ncbi:ATPase inhibitor subunit zeta [Microvirga guangxiensis]|uniref:DUF1476 domain-containing protein n=1 Tax=Microvirga guangxiensis TaxID=549386 RepID=A0A1G5KCA0_9HYPH|nr:ATPase inhibitor subunit zeta [Microvirga guangxiensis]SCY98252.1 hypothetical protein SAMN02927923_03211 [Microvirga guangxiensis]
MAYIDLNEMTRPEAVLADYDTRHGVTARRNMLVGLWAAECLGLSGVEAEDYAWSVHFADLQHPGVDDVVAKIAADFSTRGVAMKERSIREQLRELERRAELQIAAGLHRF